MALPKFYTQVLHLMNKMNLPPPFEDDAIPGAFSREREAAQSAADAAKQRKRNAPSAPAFTVEEDDDSDSEDGAEQGESDLRDAGSAPKRQRIASAAETPCEPLTASAQSRAPSLPAVHVTPPTLAYKPKARTSGFAKAFAASALGSETRGAVRLGVISEHELERQRVSSEGASVNSCGTRDAVRQLLMRSTCALRHYVELLQCDAMTDYDCGKPSRSLRVRNVAASVDEQDLAFVFGCVLPQSMELS